MLKRMSVYILTLLIFLTSISPLSVFANTFDDDMVYAISSSKECISSSNTAEYESDEDIALKNGGTATYEITDVPESGMYMVTVSSSAITSNSSLYYKIQGECSGIVWSGAGRALSTAMVKVGSFYLEENKTNTLNLTVLIDDEANAVILKSIKIARKPDIQISSEGETIIPAVDFTNRVYRTGHSDDETPSWSAASGDEPSWNRGKVIVETGNYGIFDVNIPKDGLYSFYTLTSGKAGIVNFYIDDVLISEQVALNREDSYSCVKYTRYDSVELSAGKHSIKVESYKGTFYFQAVKVLYNDVSLDALDTDKVLANSYYEKDDNVSFENGKAVLDKGEWILYKLNVPENGKYLMKIHTKSSGDGFLNLSSNGEKVANIRLIESESLAENAVFVELSEGKCLFKLFNANGALSVESFSFFKVSDEYNEKELLNDINGARNGNEVYDVLKSCGESLGIDADSLTEGIWVKESVFEKLSGRNFDTVDEFLYTLFSSVYKEKTDPEINLFVNDEKKTEFSSGNIKIEINNEKQKGNGTVLACLYEQNGKVKKLIGVSQAAPSQEGKVVAQFPNMVLKNPENVTWKIFSFDEGENFIKPYESLGNIYKEFYVSPEGNDENDGSITSPFKTIGKAKEKAEEISENMTGDIIVNIAGGEYFLAETEMFTSANSGKNGYNIIYRGNEDNRPVLHGGIEVTGWREYENGIYCAELDGVDEVRNLYVNGIAAERSKTEYAYIYLKDYDDAQTETVHDGFVTSDVYFPQVAHPEDLESVWDVSWECQRIPVRDIIDIDEKKVVLWDVDYWYSNSGLSTQISENDRYYLENALEFVDTEGEFFYDKHEKKIYYYPYKSEDLSVAKTYVAKTEGLMDIRGSGISQKVENLIFENIAFKYGAWNDVSENGLYGIQAESFIDPENPSNSGLIMPGQFSINMADNIKIKNCEFSSLGSAAVAMRNGVSNLHFEGNVLKDISGGGLSIGDINHNGINLSDENVTCRNIVVKNNVFRRVATEYRQTCAINSYYVNALTVKHNDIKGVPYSGITTGWGWESYNGNSPFYRNVDISNNKIVNSLDTLIDGGSIYNLGPAYEGRITENYLADNKLSNQPGIYLDAGSAYLNVHDNLVFSSESFFLRLQIGYRILNNNIYNNYSNTEDYSPKNKELESSNNVKKAIITDRENLPAAAQSIYDNAGVESAFSNLLENIETPDYIRNYNKTKPQQEYIGYVEGTYKDCADFESASGSYVNYGYMLGMSPDAQAEYVVYVPETGIYDFYIKVQPIKTSGTRISVDINDGEVSLGTRILYDEADKSMKVVYAGTLSLNKGENTVKLTTTIGSAHLESFYLKEVEKRQQTAITLEAESYDSCYDMATGKVTTATNYVSLKTGQWIEFLVYLDEAKTYNMKVSGGTKASKVYLVTAVNGENVNDSFHFKATGSYSPYVEQDAGDISLSAGFNRIRISMSSLSNGGIHLDKFILTAK